MALTDVRYWEGIWGLMFQLGVRGVCKHSENPPTFEASGEETLPFPSYNPPSSKLGGWGGGRVCGAIPCDLRKRTSTQKKLVLRRVGSDRLYDWLERLKQLAPHD